MNENEKVCSRCRQPLPTSAFAKNRSASDGFQSQCRNCRKRYYNLEEKREYNRRYVAENREKVNEYQRRYRADHPEQAEKAKQRRRQHYEQNKPAQLEKAAQWHADHPEKVTETQRRYYRRNQEARRENSRRWRRENPDGVARQNAERRAREAGARVEAEIDFKRIYKRYRDVCYLCGRKVKKSDRHLDHVVPLSRGGAHSEDNLRVTHSRCNLIKGTRLLEELDMDEFKNQQSH